MYTKKHSPRVHFIIIFGVWRPVVRVRTGLYKRSHDRTRAKYIVVGRERTPEKTNFLIELCFITFSYCHCVCVSVCLRVEGHLSNIHKDCRVCKQTYGTGDKKNFGRSVVSSKMDDEKKNRKNNNDNVPQSPVT